VQERAGTTNSRKTFPKRLRLSSPKLVEELFRHSSYISVPSLKLFYKSTPLPEGEPLQILISVPKKLFGKATDRNQIKRLLRESVRQYLQPLRQYLISRHESLAVGLIYTGKSLPEYSVISLYIQQLFSRLQNIHETHPTISGQLDDPAGQGVSDSTLSPAGAE
jgi:ribonuclease P protein component